MVYSQKKNCLGRRTSYEGFNPSQSFLWNQGFWLATCAFDSQKNGLRRSDGLTERCSCLSPNRVSKCGKTVGSKCMVWSGIIVVWFKGTVDVEVHLDLLQNMIRAFLDAVQHGNSIDTMQHDGAPCLVARP